MRMYAWRPVGLPCINRALVLKRDRQELDIPRDNLSDKLYELQN